MKLAEHLFWKPITTAWCWIILKILGKDPYKQKKVKCYICGNYIKVDELGAITKRGLLHKDCIFFAHIEDLL